MQRYVTVAEIVGVFGVAGWVKIFSHTRPRENVLTYSPWYLRKGQEWEPFEGLSLPEATLKEFLAKVPFNAKGRRRYASPKVPSVGPLLLDEKVISTQNAFGKSPPASE